MFQTLYHDYIMKMKMWSFKVPPFILIKLDKSHFNKEAFNGGDNNSDGNLPLT